MPFQIIQDLTPVNFLPGNISRLKYIVIHYFGALGTAQSVAGWFKNPMAKASAHYSLDEVDPIYQSVLDKDISYHCGIDQGGQYYHPACRNANSIGIEVRPRKLDTRTLYASDRDWYFDETVTDRLVEFTQYLMAMYNIPPENVLRHYDITHKYCPRPWMGDDINEYYGVSGNEKWAEFKARIEGDLTVTQADELRALIMAQNSVISEQGKRIVTLEKSNLPNYSTYDEIPAWGQEAVKDAVERKILTGVADGDLGLSWNDVRSMVFDHRREYGSIDDGK